MGDHLVGMILRKNSKLKIALARKPIFWTGLSGFNGELKFWMLDHQTERMGAAHVVSMFSEKLPRTIPRSHLGGIWADYHSGEIS